MRSYIATSFIGSAALTPFVDFSFLQVISSVPRV